MQKTHACCTTLQSNIRLILLSHGSLTKAEEKVTVSFGDKKKREREKSEKLKRNRGQFLQGQKRKKEKPVVPLPWSSLYSTWTDGKQTKCIIGLSP